MNSSVVNCSACGTYAPTPIEACRKWDPSRVTRVFWFLVREGSACPTEMVGIEATGEIAVRFRALTSARALRRPGYRYLCPECLCREYPEHIDWIREKEGSVRR